MRTNGFFERILTQLAALRQRYSKGPEIPTLASRINAATQSPYTEPDLPIYGRRYVEATARIRKFLAFGEVPGETMGKLHARPAARGDSFEPVCIE
jgi:hypothetical protein